MIALIADAVAQCPTDTASDFYRFYASNLRGGLFTGFLTLSGFLFAVKTFIIVNMKKELYDTPNYRKRVRELRILNPALTVYGPLGRLSILLQGVLCAALCTSISQFTIGLIPHRLAAIFCLSLVAVTVGLLVWALIVIRANLSDLFTAWEDSARSLIDTDGAPPATAPPA